MDFLQMDVSAFQGHLLLFWNFFVVLVRMLSFAAAFLVGIVAVALFLFSYLQKDRKRIILFNVISRCLYILQYVLLGAFSGAVLDIAGALSSVLAQKKHKPFIQKHLKLIIIGVNLLIVLAGVFVAILSAKAKHGTVLTPWILVEFLPIFGVLLHTGAFWINNEKNIRRLSLLGSPFWFAYNFLSQAYSSCIGDLFSIVSLLISICRFDIHWKKKNKET